MATKTKQTKKEAPSAFKRVKETNNWECIQTFIGKAELTSLTPGVYIVWPNGAHGFFKLKWCGETRSYHEQGQFNATTVRSEIPYVKVPFNGTVIEVRLTSLKGIRAAFPF